MVSSTTLVGATATLASVASAVSWGFGQGGFGGPGWSAPWGPQNNQPSVVGRQFNINDRVQYFAGTNSWWLGHLYYDADVVEAVKEIAVSDLKVTRVWGFGNANVNSSTSIYYQLINETLPGPYHTAINYGTNGIARLDSAVMAAQQAGVKLILNFLNNWDNLGGINTYCAVYGCNATTFYTSAAAQAAYKNYIQFIVNRYKNSDAIFAWELMNEPRCQGCDTSVIYNWASQTSAYIKSLDPTHMVTLGDEGWLCASTAPGTVGYYLGDDGSYAYSCSEGVDFSLNMGIKTLDYGTFHLYPDSWGYAEAWGNTWILQHDQIARNHNKPSVLEEYGAPYVGSGLNETVGGVNANSTLIEQQWQQTVLTNTDVAYDSFWQFGSHYLPNHEDDSDIYAIYYGTPEYQLLSTDHAYAMDAKPVVP
uniref:mannan endo-1,4-beta-mannosidase n=1 Tax=Phialophora sp. CGMCC 3329 TaxID=753978 RepID=D5IF02_9EURO|nr:endo-beta-1,4-D-mannanase [Phialophora sp. CGMCC 3329]